YGGGGAKAGKLKGLRQGWIWNRFDDNSDSQWRNFRGNLPILTLVLGIFMLLANTMRSTFHLHGKGLSVLWISLSLTYIIYLHGACTIFLLAIAVGNFLITKIFSNTHIFPIIIWICNILVLVCNRLFEGYSFSLFGQRLAYLDDYRGTFRWHICFNFVMLRMLSFGLDYHWAHGSPKMDWKRHVQKCGLCNSGKSCYHARQERSLPLESYSFDRYLCYLIYAPLYIAGPIVSFNAFSSQLDSPQKTQSKRQIGWYGCRWFLCLCLMELMTHFCYYNSLAISGVWQLFTPWEIFVVGYGVLNFMWLKFLLIWRYFRFWALIGGIEAPENMPRCINNCYDLEGFWKSWHASYNRWLVRYLYIPLGGSQRKLLNVWPIFTFVAMWHDLEWKLLSWAWVTCLFWMPEVVFKSIMHSSQIQNSLNKILLRELSAIGGAITIFFLMMANLIGFVIGPTGLQWLISRMLLRENIFILIDIFVSFYVGTK
ncbi:hypothetical protein KI387_020689, partial [Taxus chinensis]